MVDDAVVGLRGAGKRYRWGGPWVLRDVDVAVASGRIVEVRGSNGSGKSTLLRLLAGATVPSRGERVAAGGVTVGYGPERLAPPPPFSVSAYLRRHAGLRGLDRAEGERRTGALVERLGLGALMAERLDALSKGSLQKVVLVQALLGGRSCSATTGRSSRPRRSPTSCGASKTVASRSASGRRTTSSTWPSRRATATPSWRRCSHGAGTSSPTSRAAATRPPGYGRAGRDRRRALSPVRAPAHARVRRADRRPARRRRRALRAAAEPGALDRRDRRRLPLRGAVLAGPRAVQLAGRRSAVGGTALAALFSQPIVRNRAIAVLGLSACALLTLPLDLPPVVPTARALDTTHAGDVPGRLAGDLASVALSTIAVAVVCSLLWRRRE
jgi:RecA/RadA recombinase